MRIALIGAGGHAKVVFDAIVSTKQLRLRRNLRHEVIGFVDDNPQLAGTTFFDLPVVNQIELLDGVEGYIIAIGDNAVMNYMAKMASVEPSLKWNIPSIGEEQVSG